MTSLSSKLALLLVAGLVAAGCSMAPTAEEATMPADDMMVEEVEMMEYTGEDVETMEAVEEPATEEVME